VSLVFRADDVVDVNVAKTFPDVLGCCITLTACAKLAVRGAKLPEIKDKPTIDYYAGISQRT
jgi:hypothetical protein